MPESEKVIERKLRDGVKKLGGGAQCLKFESPGTSGVPDQDDYLYRREVVSCSWSLSRWASGSGCGRRMYRIRCGRLGFTVFSTVSTPEQVQTILSHCEEVMRQDGL